MSYDIVYERQFIRLPDNRIIPLILVGSNNVTEPHWVGAKCSERRARDWSIFFSAKGVAWTEDELRALVQSCVPTTYGEHFKFRSKWVDDEGFVRFFENGIKNAKTIEELKELCRYPDHVYLMGHLNVSTFTGELTPGGYKERRYSTEIPFNAQSSDRLMEFVELAEKRIASKAENEEYVYADISFADEKPVPYPKNEYERHNKIAQKQRELVNSGDFYVLKNNRGWFFLKLTSARIKGSACARCAKAFATEKEAQRYLSNHTERLCVQGLTWEVCKA